MHSDGEEQHESTTRAPPGERCSERIGGRNRNKLVTDMSHESSQRWSSRTASYQIVFTSSLTYMPVKVLPVAFQSSNHLICGQYYIAENEELKSVAGK